MVVHVCVYVHIECMLHRANRNVKLLKHLKSWLRPDKTDSAPLQHTIAMFSQVVQGKKDNGEKILKQQGGCIGLYS